MGVFIIIFRLVLFAVTFLFVLVLSSLIVRFVISFGVYLTNFDIRHCYCLFKEVVQVLNIQFSFPPDFNVSLSNDMIYNILSLLFKS